MTVSLNHVDVDPVDRPLTWPRWQLQSSAWTNRRRHAARNAARLASFFVLDATGVAVALLLLLVASPASGWGSVVRSYDPSAGWLSALAQHIVAVCAGLQLLKAYDEGDAVTDPRRVIPGVALGLLVLHWPSLWHDPMAFFTSYLPSVLLFGTAVWVERRVSDRSLRTLWRGGIEPARALFVGRTQDIEAAMHESPLSGPNAVAAVAHLDVSGIARLATDRYRSLESMLQSAIHDHAVDTIVLCSRFTDVELRHLVVTSEAAGCRVLSLSRAFHLARRGPTRKSYGHTTIVELTQPGLRGRDMLLKRVFDLLAASLLVVLLSPLLLVVALLVKRSSPGPALFRQERVGYGGRIFRIFKFRTMCLDAEQRVDELRHESVYGDGRLFKLVDDPRVTRLGRFLRRSSIDELPQLFNVLAGSMSLVGPRPPLPREVAMYGASSFLRFDVKPGITGPWQVNGRNSITSFDEVIALESAYVSGWTIWRDFAILGQTIPVVLRMEGAH